jgi:hypothetical protein
MSDVFRPLCSETTFIHSKWVLFRQLFATSKDRTELLNRAAVFVFGVFQEVLYDEIVVSLFRVTDPAKQGGFENCSLERLVNEVAADDPGLATPLQARVRALRTKLDPYLD